MSDNEDEDIESLEEDPELEQPEFEEIFQTDGHKLGEVKYREGSERKTPPFLGKLEKSKLILSRVKQLELGMPSVIPRERLRSGELINIAKQELEEKVIPIKIVRKFPDGTVEIWPVTDFKYIAKD